MPVCSDDFIDSAERLVNSVDSTEIDYRNAISRAYYGVYHAALSYANESNWPNYQGHSHEVLADRFKNAKNLAAAYILKDLHKARAAADYKLHDQISKTDTDKHLAACKRFISKLTKTN